MCDLYGEACFNQKMFTNELSIGLLRPAWVEKKVHRVETRRLSRKRSSGTAVSKEDHALNPLGHESTNHYRFPWKRCKCKQCFLLLTPQARFTLFIECRSFIYIYIYIIDKIYETNSNIFVLYTFWLFSSSFSLRSLPGEQILWKKIFSEFLKEFKNSF